MDDALGVRGAEGLACPDTDLKSLRLVERPLALEAQPGADHLQDVEQLALVLVYAPDLDVEQ